MRKSSLNDKIYEIYQIDPHEKGSKVTRNSLTKMLHRKLDLYFSDLIDNPAYSRATKTNRHIVYDNLPNSSKEIFVYTVVQDLVEYIAGNKKIEEKKLRDRIDTYYEEVSLHNIIMNDESNYDECIFKSNIKIAYKHIDPNYIDTYLIKNPPKSTDTISSVARHLLHTYEYDIDYEKTSAEVASNDEIEKRVDKHLLKILTQIIEEKFNCKIDVDSLRESLAIVYSHEIANDEMIILPTDHSNINSESDMKVANNNTLYYEALNKLANPIDTFVKKSKSL